MFQTLGNLGTSLFDELVKSHRNDGFGCRGVRPDAHDWASAARPYMQGAQKLRSEAHLQVRRNDEVEAQRSRWTFYETIRFSFLKRVRAKGQFHPWPGGLQQGLSQYFFKSLNGYER